MASDAICLCVDDFGLYPGVNEAALRLAAAGRVHAIACLSGGPAWRSAAPALARLDAGMVDVGLHLDFTECPLLPGSRHALPALIAASGLGLLQRAALRAEIRAQLDGFERALGRPPTFVDGHQHVHQLPQIRDELLAELARRYPGRPLWLRATTAAPAPWRRALKPWGIAQLGSRGLTRRARALGHGQNGRLLGVYDFGGGPARYAALLAAWLREAVHADLLMCHPSARPDTGDALGFARRAEFTVLSDANFEVLCCAAGLELRPMSRILAERVCP